MQIDEDAIRSYLPYAGHSLMAVGYILEQTGSFEAPIPSFFVLLGHICVLSDPRALSSDEPSRQVINIIFLVSNVLVFVYDVMLAAGYNLPSIGVVDDNEDYF